MFRVEFALVVSCWIATVVTLLLWALGSLTPAEAAFGGALIGFLYPFVILPYQGPAFDQGDGISRFQLFLYPTLPDLALCALPPIAMIAANAQASLLGMTAGYFAFRAFVLATDSDDDPKI